MDPTGNTGPLAEQQDPRPSVGLFQGVPNIYYVANTTPGQTYYVNMQNIGCSTATCNVRFSFSWQ